MSVIVWDGETLAADRQASYGMLPQTVSKIGFTPKFELYGITGNLSIGREVLAWYVDGADPDKYPQSNRNPNEGCSLVVINRMKEVFKYESSPYASKYYGIFVAFGSGADVAYGALAMGADAKRAVEIACQYNTACGNGVETLKF